MGTGHDAAMKLRQRLATTEKREFFIACLVSGADTFDSEDIKLALALRFQRASREGIAGSAEAYKIMNKMAACKYETAAGKIGLIDDLESLITLLPKDMLDVGPSTADRQLSYTAAKVLSGMNFCKVGL